MVSLKMLQVITVALAMQFCSITNVAAAKGETVTHYILMMTATIYRPGYDTTGE